ncbi:unnamed protein product, partial [Polarella glacialis]
MGAKVMSGHLPAGSCSWWHWEPKASCAPQVPGLRASPASASRPFAGGPVSASAAATSATFAAAFLGGHLVRGRPRRKRTRALLRPWLRFWSRALPEEGRETALRAAAVETGLIAEEEPLRVSQRSVLFLLATSGLSLLGFTMPSPILPELRQRFSLAGSEVGLVNSAFALGMMFAVMVLPVLSDRRGRKPVLAIAMACTSVGFLSQGLAIHLGMNLRFFLLARFATGLFAGCNPIFKAYLADVVPAARLPQFMVYRE